MLTQHLLTRLLDDPQLNRIPQQLQFGERRFTLSGVTEAAKPAYIAILQRLLSQPLLYVGSNNTDLEEFKRTAGFFHRMLSGSSEEHLAIFPALEPDHYSGLSPHAEVLEERALSLWKLHQSQVDILFCPPASFFSRMPDIHETFSKVPELTVGREISSEALICYLEKTGYLREEPVSAVGSFSVRGGIVDIFSPISDNPVRVEFFGDEIESLREFSVKSQRSIGPIRKFAVVPMREYVIDSTLVQQWGERARRVWDSAEYRDFFSDQVVRAANGEHFQGFEFLLPILSPFDHTILDSAPGFIIVLDEPQELRLWIEQWMNRHQMEFEELRQQRIPAIEPQRLFVETTDLMDLLQKRKMIYLDQLGTYEAGSSVPVLCETSPARRYHGNIKKLTEDIRGLSRSGAATIFVQSTAGKAERLHDIFKQYDLPCIADFGEAREHGPSGNIERHNPIVVVGNVLDGFCDLHRGVHLFGDRDVYDETDFLGRPTKSKQSSATFLSDFRELKSGDFVVHVDHGIGQFLGIKQITTDGISREFMVLNYLGDDKIYVPLERLDLIQKHSSGDHSRPPLDKLGGSTWIKTKSRIRKSMRDMADELLKLYAERRISPGFAFSPQGHWHREFEESFEYDETPDQLAAIEDVYRDMEAEIPMDRLLCGDVGFGKTEVAMRAAFKAAFDGKQVAVLAPTTVLVYQHYLRFKQRFTAFPMNIEMLSRFRNPKEQAEIVARLATGKIDVTVGTHRLLSKDVQFRDLGLLIIDEEQQFGVAHKERLKQLKKRVDTLTMTATPIPRTLHMSLAGIRDMSLIETPPRDRLAIQTLVVPFSRQVVESALRQELDRGGQAYFVHNKVESIYSVASMVQKICPQAQIVVGHGQMQEKELEATMLKFVQHQADILISTTIIENGLDIPAVNTIVVNRADRFGLAQLYQLRGRVGRSNRRAYAYLLIPPDKALTGVARQRLAALKEFSDLGSGFKIAALDLELRGAGNLLGAEQHGHINAIGFDLYCQMLERTIDEMQGAEVLPEIQTSINLKISVRIPPEYIPDESQRLSTYKRISSLKADREIDELRDELEDRYGPVPIEVESLMGYTRLRLLSEKVLVQSIERERDGIAIRFHEKTPVDPQRIVEIVSSYSGVTVTPGGSLKLQAAGWTPSEVLSSVRGLLLDLTSLN